MPKTIYPDNHPSLVLGYGVNTTVIFATTIFDGGDPNANPPIPPQPIGTKVYPEAIGGIQFSTLLEIAGVGQVSVTAVGSDGSGDYFTYSELALPAVDASIRTPWLWSGLLLYTRASGNSVTLTYTAGQHDLYFRTQKTSDSGSIGATLDGEPLGSFSMHAVNAMLAEVLLKTDVAGGAHTLSITAAIGAAVFVYFNGISVVEHAIETGGQYLYRGPAGTLEDSTNDFIGDWSSTEGYAFNSNGGGSVFIYPQLDSGGKISVRFQMRDDAAIIAVYVNGTYRRDIDLYASPGLNPIEVDILDTAFGDAPGQYAIELRNTGIRNANSSGLLFYFQSSVVYFSRTDKAALTLMADYLREVAAIRGDGAFVDAWDSNRINFDSNSLYACMGLLAAYEALEDASYLAAVKDFLAWFASMQTSAPGDPFSDGAWNIGYQVNPSPPPTYIPAIAPYDLYGMDEIKWVDAIQCLPSFVLWWYWKLSGDDATKDALLPTFKKGIDGLLRNNYDGGSGFLYSSWQHFVGGGWQLLKSRFAADQSDDVLGLIALWLMTREPDYAAVAARIIRRFPSSFWSAANAHWYISIDGDPPGVPNATLYPQTTGYTVFAQRHSRFFQPASFLREGLTVIEAYANSEGGFTVPAYAEPERIFSAFYVLGQNQFTDPTNPGLYTLAKEFIKGGQYFLVLGGQQVGGVVFSKRYQYLYTNISGFACMALAGTKCPLIEQLQFSESKVVLRR
ncbi:MAG: hypothetical protein HYX72_00770 [Acidobacteria bacterium]|nr:hypothetical protein [Acidobacteriota bacterium]